MVPAELMVRAVTVPADTVPQADDLLHELVKRERFEIVVHRRHASSLEGSSTENKVSGHSRRERGPGDWGSVATVRSMGPVDELLDERGELTGS
jgi:hypothetical protein